VRNLQIVIGPAVVLGLGQAPISPAWRAPAPGGDPRGLRAHRPRQGPQRLERGFACTPCERAAAGDHAVRHPLGVCAGRLDPVERAFGVPGLGYAMFTAVTERDVFVMQNLVFLTPSYS